MIGTGCTCVAHHSPAAYVPNRHHILPQSWAGKTTPDNLILLCANTHTATHALLDEYVRANGDPGPAVRHKYGRLAQELAARAWEQRPEHPIITSIPHGHPPTAPTPEA